MSNGVRAVRSIHNTDNTGEPSPDVLFSRRPSVNKKPASKLAAKKTLKKPTKPTQPNPKSTTSTPLLHATSTSQPIKSTTPTTLPPVPVLPETTQSKSPRSPATRACTCQCSCSNCARKNNNNKGSPSSSDGKIQLAEIAKLRAELSAISKKKKTWEQKCTSLEALAKKEQTLAIVAKSELEEASKTWSTRERELVAAGTSTLNREKNMEEQANSLLAKLSECQAELEKVRSQHNEGHDMAQAHLIAVNTETEEYKERVTELEESLAKAMQSVEIKRNENDTNQKQALETQQMLVSAAWTEAEEQMKVEKNLTQQATEELSNLKVLMKTQDQDMTGLKKRLSSAEQLPTQLRTMLKKQVEKDLQKEQRIEKEIQDLKRDIQNQNVQLEDVTKERNDLMERMGGMQNQVKQMTMNAKNMKADEFEDTFEAVMREEFDAMSSAYEDKLKKVREQSTKIRYACDKEIKDHVKSQKSILVGLKTDVMRLNAQIKVLSKETTFDSPFSA